MGQHLKKPKLVIFDMDGLMFNTEYFSFLAWKELGRKYKFEHPIELCRKKSGRAPEDVRRILKAYYGENAPIAKWHAEANEMKREMFDDLGKDAMKPGLEALLDHLDQEQIQMAVASSSPRITIKHYLEITGISDRFNHITSGEDVEKSKPDPEIFVKTLAKYNVSPIEALVLEDSISGFEAAIAAGISIAFVEDLNPPTVRVEEEAVGVFKDLLAVRNWLAEC